EGRGDVEAKAAFAPKLVHHFVESTHRSLNRDVVDILPGPFGEAEMDKRRFGVVNRIPDHGIFVRHKSLPHAFISSTTVSTYSTRTTAGRSTAPRALWPRPPPTPFNFLPPQCPPRVIRVDLVPRRLLPVYPKSGHAAALHQTTRWANNRYQPGWASHLIRRTI